MGGVEVPQAPRGWDIGEGPGRCPLLRKFFVFFVENTIF